MSATTLSADCTVYGDINRLTFDSLLQALEHGLDRYCERSVFPGSASSINFFQLDEYSLAFAAWLQRSVQLQPGTLIAVSGLDSLAGAIALFGAVRASLVVMPLPPGLSALQRQERLIKHKVKLLLEAEPDQYGLTRGDQVVLVETDGLVPFRHTLSAVAARNWQRPVVSEQRLAGLLSNTGQRLPELRNQWLKALEQGYSKGLGVLFKEAPVACS